MRVASRHGIPLTVADPEEAESSRVSPIMLNSTKLLANKANRTGPPYRPPQREAERPLACHHTVDLLTLVAVLSMDECRYNTHSL